MISVGKSSTVPIGVGVDVVTVGNAFGSSFIDKSRSAVVGVSTWNGSDDVGEAMIILPKKRSLAAFFDIV